MPKVVTVFGKLSRGIVAFRWCRQRTHNDFDKAAHGTNLRMISRADLEALPIDVPDLSTQKRIMEIERMAAEERRLSLQLMELRGRLLTSKLHGLAQTSK